MQSMARMLQLLGLKSHKKFFLCKKARKLGRKGRDHTHTKKKLQGTDKWKVSLILRVKCSYFGIFSVLNRRYFIPHTTSYSALKILNGSSCNLTLRQLRLKQHVGVALS